MKITALLTGTLIYSSAAVAAEVKELSMKRFERVWTEVSEDNRSVRILAAATYSNSCIADKAVFKSKEAQDSTIDYRVYRPSGDERNCIKIYQPTERVYVVDEVASEQLGRTDRITVNGETLLLH